MSDDIGDMLANLDRIKFRGWLRDIFKAVERRGWKVKLVVWDPATSEEWEVNPVGGRRTVAPVCPTVRVRASVRDPSDDGDSGPAAAS